MNAVRDLIVRWGFVAVTIALLAFFLATEPVFRSPDTLLSLLKFASVTAIVGLGVTVTMTTGGIDLSVGSVAGLGVSVAALTMVV